MSDRATATPERVAIDDRGVELRLAAPPARIVSLLPSLTETVCALGGCERLVGIDRYVDWPPEIAALPRLGGLDDTPPEAVVALRPDIVLMARSARLAERLEALGLRVLAFDSDRHADVERSLLALATLLGGNYVNRFNLQGRSYQVIPQVPRGLRLTPESLDGYYVPSNTGQQIPLSTLVTIKTDTDPNALTHFNQLNAATFQAVPMPGVTVGQAVDFLEQQAKQLPKGFSHDYLADARQYVTEGNQLAIAFGFALIIIFLVLAAQFESLRDPLVIMISVPMAISGALIPLFFGAATINIYTQVGLLTLIGLISKHGILMVEFANELQINERLDKRSAIEMAARVRLRPILMTTAAMVTGLLPLLTATGAGAASRFSIGLVVVAGMTIGTLFTLFVLPAVYVAIATDHQAELNSQRNKEINEFGLGTT